MVSLISFIVVIGICVIIHEGGHFFAAIWRNVQVHEFSFGMGPSLFSRRKRGILWSLRALPIGGFVRLEGMEDEPLPEDTPDPTRGFPLRKAWERFVIIAGGPLMNILLAWILTILLLMFYGILDVETPKIGSLIKDLPAETMGALPGDTVLSINGTEISKWGEIRETLQKQSDDAVAIVVEREGAKITLHGDVPKIEGSSGRLWGVQPSRKTFSIFSAAFEALSYCFTMSVDILKGLWQMITGQLEADVAGPVGIAVMAGDAVRQGLWTFVMFLAVINLNLGLLNLMPLPALDGGRLVFIVIEMITGKKFPEKWENRIHIVGMALLLALIAFITWKDIARLFG